MLGDIVYSKKENEFFNYLFESYRKGSKFVNGSIVKELFSKTYLDKVGFINIECACCDLGSFEL